MAKVITDPFQGRVMARFALQDLQARKAALLMIDFMQGYTTPGAPLYAPGVVSAVEQASGLLADIEPRHARLAGMLQNKELLAQAESALQANFSEYVSPAEEDPGQIANAALQRVRELASARGLRVTSSQTAAPREDNGFDRIGLSLRVEGDWPDLVALLRELPRQRPALYTTTVQLGVQGFSAQGTPQTMFGNLELYALKERRP